MGLHADLLRLLPQILRSKAPTLIHVGQAIEFRVCAQRSVCRTVGMVENGIFPAQLEFGDAIDLDASRRRIGGSCHHSASSQLHCFLTADALLGWHVACVCRRGASGVGVTMSATLVLQPDLRRAFAAFAATSTGQLDAELGKEDCMSTRGV